MIIHRGTLTLEKLKELADYHLPKPEVTAPVAVENPIPRVDEGVFSIRRDDDGNFSGMTKKFGAFIQVRDISPEAVLQRLLTHDGKQ